MTDGAGQPRGRSTVLLLSLAATAGALLMGSWIVASPHGSEPDASFHLVSMLCAEGYNDTDCIDTRQEDETAFVPYAVWNAPCMSGDIYSLGACSEEGFLRGGNELVSAGGNLTLKRPNLYYTLMGSLDRSDLSAWIFRVRGLNAAIFLATVLASTLVAPPALRRAVIGSWLLIAVPLVLFVMASVNTTAWGLAGSGAFWVGLATSIHAEHRGRKLAGVALLAVGATMALGSRTEAAASLSVAAIAVLLWSVPRIARRARVLEPSRRNAIAVGSAVGVAVLVTTTTLVTPAPDVLLDAIDDFGSGVDRLEARELGSIPLWLVAESWQFITGAFGDRWGLGWLDVPMPTVVAATTLFVLAGTAFAGLATVRAWRGSAILFTLTAMLVYPWLTLVTLGFFIGEAYQPRHFLSILQVLVALLLLPDEGHEPLRVTRPQRAVMWSALTLGHAMALHVLIRRYTVGLTMDWRLDLSAEAEWWWQWAPFGPTAVWVVGSIAFAVVAAVALFAMTRTAQPTSETAPARPTE